MTDTMSDMVVPDEVSRLNVLIGSVRRSRVGSAVAKVIRRAAGASRYQTLRRTPWLIGLGVAIVTAPFLWSVTGRLVSTQQELLWVQVESEASERLMKTQSMLAGGPQVEDSLMFLVVPKDKVAEPYGPTDIEPPLFQLAAQVEAGQPQSWFQQNGRSLRTFGRRIDDTRFLIAVVDISWFDAYGREKESGIRRRSQIGWLLTALSTVLLTHLALRPARKVLRERTDFLADAAHELRTPIAVIQASAGHALSRERETIDYVQSLAEIRAAAERAGAGVSELLDLARFDAGQAVPRLAPLRLDLLAEEVIAATRLDDCELRTEIGPSVLVQADMALLRQAVDNLVRNASSRAGQVLLRCSVSGTDGVLEVVDDGPGFAKEQLPYVFERYRRGDGRGSMGLGLPIAASIVAAHGGRIDVTSPSATPLNDEGRPGATVTIRLPLSRV
jgi:signal transduction histidine kinase